MRTFAELLTEYMLRTGISDSELARTLGVRRQTIFRWKEGLVDKPRYREDVLRVAERLRLTPPERDGLLLAAGFPPESTATVPPHPPAPAQGVQTGLPPVPVDSVPAVPPLASNETAPTILLGGLPRRLWIAVAWALAFTTVVLLSAALLLIYRSNLNSGYPIAAPGETLVLIAPLDSASSSKNAPGRTVTGSETPALNDISERIRAALEREIQGARLERARVVIAPEAIADRNAAETVMRRSQAKLVIGGTYENGSLSAWFVAAPAASRVDDLPLDALIAPPLDIQIKIDIAAPDQVQSVALIALSQLYVDRGDFALARAALSRRPAETQPLWLAQMGYIDQIGKPPDLIEAIDFYSQTIALVPDAPTPFLNRGVAFIRQNKTELWQADLTHAQTLRSDLAVAQALCWGWLLDQQPNRALPECDTGVRLDPTARSRDARAIVYAQAGRFADAAADWQLFLDWLAQQPESLRARYGSTRTEWRQAVQAGRNPIDAPTLENLRRQ